MKRYYDIYPIRTAKRGSFGAIEIVAHYADEPNEMILAELGFASFTDLAAYCRSNSMAKRFFHSDHVIMNRLNDICRARDLPLRFIREVQ